MTVTWSFNVPIAPELMLPLSPLSHPRPTSKLHLYFMIDGSWALATDARHSAASAAAPTNTRFWFICRIFFLESWGNGANRSALGPRPLSAFEYGAGGGERQ